MAQNPKQTNKILLPAEHCRTQSRNLRYNSRPNLRIITVCMDNKSIPTISKTLGFPKTCPQVSSEYPSPSNIELVKQGCSPISPHEAPHCGVSGLGIGRTISPGLLETEITWLQHAADASDASAFWITVGYRQKGCKSLIFPSKGHRIEIRTNKWCCEGRTLHTWHGAES